MDFWLASMLFWQTLQQLRKGKWVLSQTVFGLDRGLLTWTKDIVEQWKENFEDLLNPSNFEDLLNPSIMSTFEEAESCGENKSITLAEVIEVDQKLLGCRAPGLDYFLPEMLKCSE